MILVDNLSTRSGFDNTVNCLLIAGNQAKVGQTCPGVDGWCVNLQSDYWRKN